MVWSLDSPGLYWVSCCAPHLSLQLDNGFGEASPSPRDAGEPSRVVKESDKSVILDPKFIPLHDDLSVKLMMFETCVSGLVTLTEPRIVW